MACPLPHYPLAGLIPGTISRGAVLPGPSFSGYRLARPKVRVIQPLEDQSLTISRAFRRVETCRKATCLEPYEGDDPTEPKVLGQVNPQTPRLSATAYARSSSSWPAGQTLVQHIILFSVSNPFIPSSPDPTMRKKDSTSPRIIGEDRVAGVYNVACS